MSFTFPRIEIGEPQRYKSLAVFPLFTTPTGKVEYVLSDIAIASGAAVVEEMSMGGSVPDLAVRNIGEVQVLFLEGEELCGAMQNRILNSSVLVAAHSRTQLPVSCVEQGRWWLLSKAFSHSGAVSPSGLRRVLKRSVTESTRLRRTHHSDQAAVWAEIERQQSKLDTRSDTNALSDTRTQHEHQITDCREQLPYVAGAAGIAVAIGAQVVSVDLFDKPSTCEQVWSRLLTGLTLDVVEQEGVASTASKAQVAKMLRRVRLADWVPTPTPGVGEEFRAQTYQVLGSALVCDGSLIHSSLIAAV